MKDAATLEALKYCAEGMDNHLALALFNVASTLRIASDRIKLSDSLTEDEQAIIAAYRKSNAEVKQTIKNALGVKQKNLFDDSLFNS